MKSIVDVIKALDKLVRTGWLLRGVPPSIAETVASHSFTSAIIALEVANKLRDRNRNINPYKAAVLALVHDVGEAFIGDIVKEFSKRSKIKEEVEEQVLKEYLDGLAIGKLAVEYISQKTLEARIAKLAEVLATYIKGLEYMALGYRDVKEIVENMLTEAMRLSKELKVESILEEVVSLAEHR
ncbi:MAG: HD family hydrolase [Pyrodictiaceae archaeon]